MRALATNGQTGTVTQATEGLEVHEPLDVHRGFTTQVAFDSEVCIDRFTNAKNFLVGKILNPARVINAKLVGDFDGL